MIEYYNEDCMEGMKRYGDKHFSLAIYDASKKRLNDFMAQGRLFE